MKYHIKINANTESELVKELEQAAYLLTSLYEAVKKADTSYGGTDVVNKNYWKGKAEKWVNERKIIIDG